jgi:hypothetical protein
VNIQYRGMTIILRPWASKVAMTWHLPDGKEAGSGETYSMESAIALAKEQIDKRLARSNRAAAWLEVRGWFARLLRGQ